MLRVLTCGTFDLFHIGHVNILRYCRELSAGGSVTVSVNTDDFVLLFKGKAPICSLEERKAVLEACRYVDYVLVNTGGMDSKPAIELANPQMLVIGSDWLNKDYHKQLGLTADWLADRKIGLSYVPYTQGISTTDLRSRILK
jgi:glycerol-3-phosphate cytidylyltransferase